MSDFDIENKGHITLNLRNEIKPNEIDLKYLIHDSEEEVSDIKPHDYDLSIYNLDFSKLEFLEKYEEFEKLLKDNQILSIERVYNLRLLDLSLVGFVPDPSVSGTYDYINQFIDCINDEIDQEVLREKKFSLEWENEYRNNLNKFKIAQCNNKIGYLSLYFLKFKVNRLLKRANKLLHETQKKPQNKKFKIKFKKFSRDVYSLIISDISELMNKNTKFSNLNLKLNGKFKFSKNVSNSNFQGVLSEYAYFLKYYKHFLSIFLRKLKKDKVKRATKIFNTDSFKYKKACLNSISEKSSIEAYEYNLSYLYNLFRVSLSKKINKIVDNEIKRRKAIDGFFQYIPNVISVAAFLVVLGMYFTYKYTLLKDIFARYNILSVFIVLVIGAMISLINLYRNTKQFKRPKRAKFQKKSLKFFISFIIISISLGVYFINRYDGYNDIYYYINGNDSTIIIDGLVKDDNSIYNIPKMIDAKPVSLVSNKTFKRNDYVTHVDFLDSNATIEKAAFLNCSKLKYVNLSDSTTIIPERAFKDCPELLGVNYNNISKIEKNAFYDCIKLNHADLSKVIYLESYAFKNCWDLEDVVFSENLEVIQRNVFENCKKLSFPSLPTSLKTIETKAFFNCFGLNVLSIPENVDTIGKEAFGNCSNISTLEINNFEAIEENDIYYVFGKEGLKLVNSITIKNCTYIPDNFLKDKNMLQSLSIDGDFDTIGENAFSGCISLNTVALSGKLKFIESSAFENCESLINLSFTGDLVSIGDYAFKNCKNLPEFIIPSTVRNIGDYAFQKCNSFTQIDIPMNVEEIGIAIFFECFNIVHAEIIIGETTSINSYFGDTSKKMIPTIYVKDSNEIPDGYFKDCLSLSTFDFTNITKIGDFAFSNTALTELNLPNIIYLGVSAFSNCDSLVTANIGLGLTTIPDSLFNDCSGLVSISGAENVTKIGDLAFRNCYSLTSYPALSSALSIGDSAFQDCRKLETINLSKNIEKIGSSAFKNNSLITSIVIENDNVTIGEEAFFGCTSINDVRIPLTSSLENSEGLGNYFEISTLNNILNLHLTNVNLLPADYLRNLSSLIRISIDGNLTNIEESSFKNFTSLVFVHLPESVENIEASAFENCTNLIEVNMPSSLKTINEKAFYGCASLLTITLPNDVYYIGPSAFFGSEVIIENLENQNYDIDWHNEWNRRS